MASSNAAPTMMQVELTYKAEPTLMMTCITRVKAAEVCKEVDDDSGIEFGEVDLRVCLRAILAASPELKKEPWSVYVLDQSASDRKFSGNGTITSVLEEDEPVLVVGRVKKKFRKELLDIELRLVPITPAKKQSAFSLEELLPLALQRSSLHNTLPAPSSPILPAQSSPTLPTRRLLAPLMQQEQQPTPPASSFPTFTDQLWTDFEVPIQDQDFSIIETHGTTDFNIQWPLEQLTLAIPPLASIDTPSLPTAPTPFAAPIPPPPLPGPPTPIGETNRKRSKKRSTSSHKSPQNKRNKKSKRELTMPSSPPIRALKHFSTEDVDVFLSEGQTPAALASVKPLNNGSSWEEFLVSDSDSESQRQNPQTSTTSEHPPPPAPTNSNSSTDASSAHPVIAFTAVNSTLEASREFTARQLLLNAEFTPISSPDRSPSGGAQTESDYASSPNGLTPFAAGENPAASQDAGLDGGTSANDVDSRTVLSDVTLQTANNPETLAPTTKEKRRRGRPRGWKKPQNKEAQTIESLNRAVAHAEAAASAIKAAEKPRKSKNEKDPAAPKEDDQWSKRIRANITESMLEHISQGKVPKMCYCCGEILPASWRYLMINDNQERFCNACGLYYKKHGVFKNVQDPPKKPVNRPRLKRKVANVPSATNAHLPVVETEPRNDMCPSSPPQRTYEPMSEIDHPLLSEGICLPRMGYLRGVSGDSLDSGEEDEETIGDKENVEPDDDAVERFFSDIFA